MSRPFKKIDDNKLLELYTLYIEKEITKIEMAKQLNISTATLDKRIKELKNNFKNEQKDEKIEPIDSQVEGEISDEIQIFNNEEFGSVRTLNIKEEMWFSGKDIANALGYSNSRKALIDHVEDEDKQLINTVTNCYGIKKTGNPRQVFINESGLYSLILSSKLPSAKKFKYWITSEVLPSIRNHGAYMTSETLEQALYNPDFLIKLATNLKNEQEKNIKLQKENKELSTVNSVLVKEANEWNDRSLIIHLMRKYGCIMYNNRFGIAWREFYKNLNYKLHINLNHRLSLQDDKKKKALDMVRDDEWESILKIAVAMCEDVGIKTIDIIEKHRICN